MITRNNPMTYFIHRGRQVGFEYELMRKFAEQHDLRLDIVIPDSHADVLTYLREGKGDVVAAAMTITPERRALAAFSPSLQRGGRAGGGARRRGFHQQSP